MQQLQLLTPQELAQSQYTMMLNHSRIGEDLMNKLNKKLKDRILRNVASISLR